LGVASGVTLLLAPPVGIALGVGSAAVGGAASAGDAIGDHMCSSRLAKEVSEIIQNTLAVAELEREWLEARDKVAKACSTPKMTSNYLDETLVSSARGAHVSVGVAKSIMNAVEPAAPFAAKAVGVVGSALSVGIAIHGWSTTKSLQSLVTQQIEDLDRRIPHFERWLADVGSE